MHMPIHQAGQQQIPAQIQHLACRGRRGIGGQDCRNPPILQRQALARRPAIGQTKILQNRVIGRFSHALPPHSGVAYCAPPSHLEDDAGRFPPASIGFGCAYG